MLASALINIRNDTTTNIKPAPEVNLTLPTTLDILVSITTNPNNATKSLPKLSNDMPSNL